MDFASLFGISPDVAEIAYQVAIIMGLLISICSLIRHMVPDPIEDENTAHTFSEKLRSTWFYYVLFSLLDECQKWSKWVRPFSDPATRDAVAGFLGNLGNISQMEQSAKDVSEKLNKMDQSAIGDDAEGEDNPEEAKK